MQVHKDNPQYLLWLDCCHSYGAISNHHGHHKSPLVNGNKHLKDFDMQLMREIQGKRMSLPWLAIVVWKDLQYQ